MKHPIISFIVQGTPRPQPRPRFANGRVVSEIDPKVKQWQAAVRHAATMAKEALGCGFGGIPLSSAVADALGGGKALRVDITFFFGTRHRERWGKPHTFKPDRDNLDKLILDEMTKVQLIAGDDCRVSAGTIRKRWCDLQGSGALVRVYADDEEDTGTQGVVQQIRAEGSTPAWLNK